MWGGRAREENTNGTWKHFTYVNLNLLSWWWLLEILIMTYETILLANLMSSCKYLCYIPNPVWSSIPIIFQTLKLSRNWKILKLGQAQISRKFACHTLACHRWRSLIASLDRFPGRCALVRWVAAGEPDLSACPALGDSPILVTKLGFFTLTTNTRLHNWAASCGNSKNIIRSPKYPSVKLP